MALTFHTYKFLDYLKNSNYNFGKVLSLGKINNLLTKDDFQNLELKFSNENYADNILKEIFKFETLECLDYSSFEGAEIIHDLNFPIISADKQFDTILDFGISEHVFNIAQCIFNIIKLTKINGSIIHCLPANNNCGHGFWQFSPELFFNLYKKKNGFTKTEIFLINLHDQTFWYKVNIQKLGERLEINSSEPLYLIVKTIKENEVNFTSINQSDYEHQWNNDKFDKPKKSATSIKIKKIKDSVKYFLRHNFLSKNYYQNLEKKKLHDKNNFKTNKNLIKLKI